MKRILSLGLTLAVLVGLISSCAPSAPTAEEPAAPAETSAPEAASEAPEEPAPAPETAGPQGTLRVGLPAEPSSLYIPTTPDKISDIAASQLYDPLVFQNSEGEIVPALAESWETSEDGTVWTFHLRQGVIVHNKSGRQAILAKRLIDASGDADLASYTGAPFRKKPREDMLPVTVMFSCSGVNKKRFLTGSFCLKILATCW